MQEALQVTMDYAAAFEETYADDDWSRLARFFAPDAVYEVRGGPLACRLEGREAIFAGLKKSIDGLDRRMDQRHIALTDGPDVKPAGDATQVSMGWRVKYVYGEAPPVGFDGRSIARIADGVIVELRDEYEDALTADFEAWMAEHGAELDGAYI